MFPLLPPPPPHAKRRREEREQGTNRSRAPHFQGKSARHRSPPGERPRPVVMTATQRLPAHGLPRCGHCPQGTRASIGASCTLIMSRQSLEGTALARWTHRSTPTPLPTRFGNGPKPATAHTRGNQTDRPEHTLTRTIMSLLTTARGRGPRNCETSQHGLPRRTLTIAHLNRQGTESCADRATWYDLDQPVLDQHQDASDCRNQRLYHPAFTTSLPSLTVHTNSG